MLARIARWAFVLLVALVASPLPPVHATHGPTAEQAAAVMVADQTMECFSSGAALDCTPTSASYQWRYARISPNTGPLAGVYQQVPAYIEVGYFIDFSDADWVGRVQAVGCLDAGGVSRFVTDMTAALQTPNTSFGPRIVGECSLTGSLIHDTRACPSAGCYYSVTSTILAGAFPTPTPPPPTPPPPASTPTATPSPTASPSPTPRPSPSRSPSPTPSPTPTEKPSGTPEGTVGGIIFEPQPSAPPPEQAPTEVDAWVSSVPDPADVSTEPVAIASSALLALLLLLFMGFVGELFNNTAKANYDVLVGWWSESWLGRHLRWFTDFWKAP